MIITISTPDEFFFNQLLAFLTSLEINSPGYYVRVALIDYPKGVIKKLEKSFKHVEFVPRSTNLIDERGIGLILYRIKMVQECFNDNQRASWIDTDVLVRKDLNDFVSIQPNQLKIFYRGYRHAGQVEFEAPINAGIFNIGCSESTYNFTKTWYEGLSNNPRWGQGQVELWRAYQKHKDAVDLIKMPLKFNDLGDRDNPNMFDDNSVMWHCKRNHFNNEKFQNEFKYYLEKGQRWYNR